MGKLLIKVSMILFEFEIAIENCQGFDTVIQVSNSGENLFFQCLASYYTLNNKTQPIFLETTLNNGIIKAIINPLLVMIVFFNCPFGFY